MTQQFCRILGRFQAAICDPPFTRNRQSAISAT
jgi:hypothetical protein